VDEELPAYLHHLVLMQMAHEAEQAARGNVADGDFVRGGLLSVKAINEVADQFPLGSVLHLDRPSSSYRRSALGDSRDSRENSPILTRPTDGSLVPGGGPVTTSVRLPQR
jgi:hypothetical protein